MDVQDETAHLGRHRAGRGGDGVDAAAGGEPVEAVAPVRLVTLPGALRDARLGVGGGPVRGLLVLLVVTVLVLGGRWWWVQQRATAVPLTAIEQEEQPEVGEAGGAVTMAPGAGPGSAATPAAGSAADGQEPVRLLVHVVGEVREPGVVELPSGARVVDALEAAGGATERADLGAVNLARPVLDGEQVWVGAPGEEPPLGVGSPAAGSLGAAGAAGGSGAVDAAGQAPGLVDLNTATQEALESLPGVGPVTAGRILAWREENGRFTDVSELLEVSGIGERTLEQLEPLVSVGG